MKKIIWIVQYIITFSVISGFSISFLYNLIPLALNPTIYSERKEYIREEFSRIEPYPTAVKEKEHTLNKFTQISITAHYLIEDDIAQIDKYYRDQLTRLGWQETYTTEPNLLQFTKGKLIFQISRVKDNRKIRLYTGIYYDGILVI
mgnify:FL=1